MSGLGNFFLSSARRAARATSTPRANSPRASAIEEVRSNPPLPLEAPGIMTLSDTDDNVPLAITFQRKRTRESVAVNEETVSLFPYIVPEEESPGRSTELLTREKRRKALNEPTPSRTVNKTKNTSVPRAKEKGKGVATPSLPETEDPQLVTKRRTKAWVLKICPDRAPLDETVNNISWMTPQMKSIISLPVDEALETVERIDALSFGLNHLLRMRYIHENEKLEEENRRLKESEDSSFRQLTATITEESKKDEEDLDLKTQLEVNRSEISSFEERVKVLNERLNDAVNQASLFEGNWKSSCAENVKLQEELSSKVTLLSQTKEELLREKEIVRTKEASLEAEKLKTSSLAQELEENNGRLARKDVQWVEVCRRAHDAFILDNETQTLNGEFFFDVHLHGQRVGAAKQARAFPDGGAPLDEEGILSIEDQAGVPIFDKDIPLFSDEFKVFLENFLKRPEIQKLLSSQDGQADASSF